MKYIKIGCVFLLTYTFTAGYLFDVPALPILNETVRALYLHVPMWFTMIFLLLLIASAIATSCRIRNKKNKKFILIILISTF